MVEDGGGGEQEGIREGVGVGGGGVQVHEDRLRAAVEWGGEGGDGEEEEDSHVVAVLAMADESAGETGAERKRGGLGGRGGQRHGEGERVVPGGAGYQTCAGASASEDSGTNIIARRFIMFFFCFEFVFVSI